jgi:hypothetical protein
MGADGLRGKPAETPVSGIRLPIPPIREIEGA